MQWGLKIFTPEYHGFSFWSFQLHSGEQYQVINIDCNYHISGTYP